MFSLSLPTPQIWLHLTFFLFLKLESVRGFDVINDVKLLKEESRFNDVIKLLEFINTRLLMRNSVGLGGRY